MLLGMERPTTWRPTRAVHKHRRSPLSAAGEARDCSWEGRDSVDDGRSQRGSAGGWECPHFRGRVAAGIQEGERLKCGLSQNLVASRVVPFAHRRDPPPRGGAPLPRSLGSSKKLVKSDQFFVLLQVRRHHDLVIRLNGV